MSSDIPLVEFEFLLSFTYHIFLGEILDEITLLSSEQYYEAVSLDCNHS